MLRAGFYIDGFNFYHAVDDLGKPWLKWMCYRKLAGQLLRKGHLIETIKFFTALPNFRTHSLARHRAFIEAAEHAGIEVVLGEFKEKFAQCRSCGSSWKSHEEKESDVNLAIHLLADGLLGKIDVAYILSTDSDLAPPCRMLKNLRPDIHLITVKTPGRSHSFELLQCCHFNLKTSEEMIMQSLLPAEIIRLDGTRIARPSEYTPRK